MAFIKVVKNKSYFKRYQTKYRRRREGKTDYFARKRLIIQDKNKYNTPKYRLVARITCSKVIAQIIYATIQGDKVLAQAESTELRRFGLTAGLTNYSSAYATGLLLARRLLKQVGLDTIYAGNKTVNGEQYNVANTKEAESAPRQPFRAYLDVGLIRTTTGNRVFGVLKGAVDGGINVPHSVKRFPGFTAHENKETYDAKKHRERIFGLHVQNYMKVLKEEGQEAYNKQFRRWDETLKAAKVDTVEKLYQKVHDEIRKNPVRPAAQKKEKQPIKWADKARTIVETSKGKYRRDRRLTKAERDARVQQKLKIALSKAK